MQAWLLDSRASCLPVATAAAVVDGIGRRNFAERLLAEVRPHVAVSHCVIIGLTADGAKPLGFSSLSGEGARIAGYRYIDRGYFRQDNNLRLVEEYADDLFRGKALMSIQAPEDVLHADHRQYCYERLGIVQRLSLLCPREAGDGPLFLNFYRVRGEGAAAPRELDVLRGMAPLLMSAVARHAEFPSPRDTAASRVAALLATLSARERAVIEGVCDGLSSKEIARRLGIEPCTVTTYRQRAYRHLGIQRQHDLIHLFRHCDQQ